MSIHQRIETILVGKLALIHEQAWELNEEICAERRSGFLERPDADDKRFIAQLDADMDQLERKLQLVRRYLAQQAADEQVAAAR